MLKQFAFITGITGQDGAYLSQFLLSKGYEVHGMVRSIVAADLWRLKELHIADRIHLVEGDMQDAGSLSSLVKKLQPVEVYNLAAWSSVASSVNAPEKVSDVNAAGVERLLAALLEHCKEARFFQASSAAMYGSTQGKVAADESTSFTPQNPYAVSKLLAHQAVVAFREQHGMFACNGILFNHESPLRGLEFVTRKISDGVARISLGLADHIALGDLDACRDWGFAGDYVEAMWLTLQQSMPEDYVVATGISHTVRDFLDLAFHEVGIDDWSSYVQRDDQYARSQDVRQLCGNSSKARRVLGWTPRVPFEELVRMMVQSDIARLSSSLP